MIQIVKSSLQTQKANRVFSYLKENAETIDGNKIFTDNNERISFIFEIKLFSTILIKNKSINI